MSETAVPPGATHNPTLGYHDASVGTAPAGAVNYVFFTLSWTNPGTSAPTSMDSPPFYYKCG